MKVAVWDTYVKRTDGKTMHFDILVKNTLKDASVIFAFGKNYLNDKDVISTDLTIKECEFCHIEEATEQVVSNIEAKGYHIVEMENCE